MLRLVDLLLQAGGFTLKKWISNVEEVLHWIKRERQPESIFLCPKQLVAAIFWLPTFSGWLIFGDETDHEANGILGDSSHIRLTEMVSTGHREQLPAELQLDDPLQVRGTRRHKKNAPQSANDIHNKAVSDQTDEPPNYKSRK